MINIPKGTKDVLPNQSYKWQFIENKARKVARIFNLSEVRTPTFEYTDLFNRGVGDTTDVVNKEMYTFEDKGGRSITLKPEGTAGVVRSFIENGLANMPMPLKTYYITPAFRYERPQAGRLREFHQFGIEVFGSKSFETDVEVILAADTFLKSLKVKTKLKLNSIGCPVCRAQYNSVLKNYFAPHLYEMCQTCQARYEKNPLRMLDCKEERCKMIAEGAPKIVNYLCNECENHFNGVKGLLDRQGVKYTIDSSIVRGLDYYTKTVFEFVSEEIGSQGTVCGGGRYDGLVENLGGPKVPAIGFAAGIERLMLLMENTNKKFGSISAPLIYVVGLDQKCKEVAFKLASDLREEGIAAEIDHMERSVKAQFKYADKLGVKYVGVIGENELYCDSINVKNMKNGEQTTVKLKDVKEYIKNKKKDKEEKDSKFY